MTREQHYRRVVMNIAAGFVVLALLLVIVWGIVSVVTEIIRPDIVHEEKTQAEKMYSDVDSLSLLIVKLSDDKTAPEEVMLTRFEPSESRVYVTGMPSDVVIEGKKLSAYYTENGMDGMCSAVGGLCGIERLCYIDFTYSDITSIINIFDTVTVTVPYDINYTSPDGKRNIITAAGTRPWTGGELGRLLNYPNWEGGDREQLGMYTMVLCNLINENAVWKSEDRLKADYLHLNAAADVNIPMGIYHMVSDGLMYIAEMNTGSVAINTNIYPDTLDDGTLAYRGESLNNLVAVFSDRDLPEEE